MKSLFTILMSLHLILSPVAFAQSTAQPADKEVDKMLGKKAGDVFRENLDAKAGKGGYNKMILGMGIGIVGANILTTCAKGGMYPSIMLFQGGGIIYILSELLGGKAHNDYLKKKTEDLKMVEEKMTKQGGGGEVQKEALDAALANEKEILKFINKRKKWFTAITVVFAAATAAAIAEMIFPWPVPLGLIPAVCIGPKAIGSAKVTSAAITAAYTFAAGGGVMGAGFAAALSAFAVPASAVISSSKNLAPGRIAVNGMATVLVKGILSDLSKKAKTAKENIEKLERAIAEFEKSSAPTNGIKVATGSLSDANDERELLDSNTLGSANGGLSLNGQKSLSSSSASGLNRLPENARTAQTKICGSTSDAGFDVSEKGCSTPFRFNPGGFENPDINVEPMRAVTQSVSDISANLASGNLEAAEVGAASLVAQAGRINELKDSLLKKANAKLAANGKPLIDVDASVADQINTLSASLQKENPMASKAIANLRSGSSVDLNPDLKGIADLKESAVPLQDPAQKNNASGAISSGNPNEGSNGPELEGGYQNNPSPSTEAAESTQTLSEGLEAFEGTQDDISNKSDMSIFKQVSNRYILNYPTLVRRKSLDAVESKTK